MGCTPIAMLSPERHELGFEDFRSLEIEGTVRWRENGLDKSLV